MISLMLRTAVWTPLPRYLREHETGVGRDVETATLGCTAGCAQPETQRGKAGAAGPGAALEPPSASDAVASLGSRLPLRLRVASRKAAASSMLTP